MDLDNLKATWEKEILIMDNTLGFASTISLLEKDIDSLDKTIKRRDFKEIFISLLVLPVLCFSLYNSTNLIQISAIIILIFMNLFIPFKFWKAKQIKTSKIVSIKEFLGIEKVKVMKQIQLSKSIARWYLGPLFVGGVLLFIGSIYSVKDEIYAITVAIMFVILFGVVSIVYKRIYSIHQAKIKKPA